MRRYGEMIRLKTFEERFEYLKMNGDVGKETFGFDRWMNQKFYSSREWEQVRNRVIVRDNGCDLGMEDRPIGGRIVVHHMNPISSDDIKEGTEMLLNEEYLICVSEETHKGIHYGELERIGRVEPNVRRLNDTCPWKIV